jgi:hypothetical protein
MFHSPDEQKVYIAENYPEVTDSRIDEGHWDLECTACKMTRGFQVTKREIAGFATEYSPFNQDFDAPVTYIFRCPVCKAFKQWIIYEPQFRNASGHWERHYFRVTSVPSEGLEDIAELPTTPPSLQTAYKQAVRAMDANANIAAAAMFRRALQVITRELLGAKPGNLANELNEVVGKPFNGGVVTTNFASVGYIIKEAGNQGAHPDQDPDLLDFTAEDAKDLQQVFMEVVSELFVIPAAKEKARQDFLARRKITARPAVPVKP